MICLLFRKECYSLEHTDVVVEAQRICNILSISGLVSLPLTREGTTSRTELATAS